MAKTVTKKKTADKEIKNKTADKSTAKQVKPKKEEAISTSIPLSTTPTRTNNQLKSLMSAIFKGYQPTRKTYLIIFLIGLAIIIFYNKNWFVAASVNSTPISNFELISKMNQQFRSQVLDQMINERIILEEAQKNNIKIAKNEVEEKIKDLETSLGGPEILTNLLAQQGQTRESLNNQIEIQLVIEQLYANEATSSTEEISRYLADNKNQMQATTPAEQAKEAEEILKQQKLTKVFSEKFQQLKQKAKINIF